MSSLFQIDVIFIKFKQVHYFLKTLKMIFRDRKTVIFLNNIWASTIILAMRNMASGVIQMVKRLEELCDYIYLKQF